MELLAVATWISVWLTPLWLLGVGAALGMGVLLVLWLLLFIVSRRGAAAVPMAVTEGPLFVILIMTAVLTVFGLTGWLVANERGEILASIQRLPFVGANEFTLELPAESDDGSDPELVEFPVSFRADEFMSIQIDSNSDLRVTLPTEGQQRSLAAWEVTGGDSFSRQRGIDANFGPMKDMNVQLAAQNIGDRAATVQVALVTAPKHPQVASVLITAISVVGVFLVFLSLRWLMPKAMAIALATAKSEMTQPLFLLLVGLGLFLLLLFMFVPYHTFGEDIKVLKDSGLTLIMVFAIISAVWGASNSISEEIEGRTAVTVLSKPIARHQFILGKFFGISWTSLVMFVLLGVWLLIVVAYKPLYDARESANTEPTWQACQIEVARTVPGLVLAFFETLVFVAISVAISTRLPLLANLTICFAIYAFGHLTPLLVQSGEGQFENVKFLAQFIATVLPVLDHFNIQAAVATGISVPLSYLGMATIYCALYCTVALLLAQVLFEDRDVA